jgi:hypothetical protein
MKFAPRIACIVLAAAVAVAAAPAPASAADGPGFAGWGPRIGVTSDPDQIHMGLHIDVGNFADHIRFQPNMDVGFGDDVTLVSLNGDLACRFRSQWDVWSPYLGGGIAFQFWDVDNRGSRFDDSDTEVGLNLLGGIERGLSGGNRFFTELKLGLVDTPDFKATVGWTFR